MTASRSSRRAPRAAVPPVSSIEVSEEAGVRYLHFGSRWIQGAMRLSRTHALELEYTRDMMFPLLLHPDADWPRTVLQIGLGAASITRFLHRHRPGANLVVAEIEPRVVAAARQHFRLPEDPARVSIEIADGAAYVADAGRSFDWILVDGFDERGLAGALDTRAFYRRCRACLSPDGLVVANLLRRSRGSEASIARMAEAFDGRLLVLPVCASGNTIAIGVTGAHLSLDRTELRAAAEALRRTTGLNLVRTVGRLAAAAPLSAPLRL